MPKPVNKPKPLKSKQLDARTPESHAQAKLPSAGTSAKSTFPDDHPFSPNFVSEFAHRKITGGTERASSTEKYGQDRIQRERQAAKES